MWIKNRIDTEYKKHKDLDWSRIAEAKIISQIKFLIDEAPDIDYVGEYLKKKLSSENSDKENKNG